MNQEKFGQFIKEIRKKHNLTQKQLAHKYNVTYQAVSKWETGKNMPDNTLIKQISKDFDVSLDELFNGEYSSKKKRKKTFFITFLIIIILIIMMIFLIFKFANKNDFQFKTLTTNCENFNISGNISYNSSKSAIYVTNIKYCGKEEDKTEYKQLECILYESNNDTERKISSYKYAEKRNITLEEFLQNVTLTIDNYENTCKEYKDNSLYLSINALDNNDKTINYKIPLKLESCSK